uniref:Uncharacterized protein n=1 Tax=Manihot esculenta TaxID=3983 RepID=A0A2C9VGU6_MANES
MCSSGSKLPKIERNNRKWPLEGGRHKSFPFPTLPRKHFENIVSLIFITSIQHIDS